MTLPCRLSYTLVLIFRYGLDTGLNQQSEPVTNEVLKVDAGELPNKEVT